MSEAHAADERSNNFSALPNRPAKVRLGMEYRGYDHVLRPGGLVVIRQLNSQLAIRDVPCSLRWLVDEAARWHTEDRSFFYRELHVGRKR